jgi:hypothetical protein
MTMTLVLGCSLCSQSFGFDLLDRMLGVRGCGSASNCCDSGCNMSCNEPACGCEQACAPDCADPCCDPDPCGDPCGDPCDPCDPCNKKGGMLGKLFSCDLFKKNRGCDDGCCGTCGETDCCDPACCEPEPCCPQPVCGCEAPVDCCDPCGDPCGQSGCDSCNDPCRKTCLLNKLFGNLGRNPFKNRCCDDNPCCEDTCNQCCPEPVCGCEPTIAPVAEPAAAAINAAPMPPRSVIDPSARVSTKRHVIQASAVYVR